MGVVSYSSSLPEDYYSHPRPEVRALVPPAARLVVDVGCGAGALGAALKAERPGIQVRGIEVSPEAAARAAEVLDAVEVSAAAGIPPSWPAPDCIILADVLEHMVDPWTALRDWGSCLRDGGHVVISLPNVAHVSVLAGLWRGRWDYEEEGLLDRTHLRFFTRETAIELVEGAGLEVEELRRAVRLPGGRIAGTFLRWLIRRGANAEARREPVPGSSAKALHLPSAKALDLLSRQFLLRARKTGSSLDATGDRA